MQASGSYHQKIEDCGRLKYIAASLESFEKFVQFSMAQIQTSMENKDY